MTGKLNVFGEEWVKAGTGWVPADLIDLAAETKPTPRGTPASLKQQLLNWFSDRKRVDELIEIIEPQTETTVSLTEGAIPMGYLAQINQIKTDLDKLPPADAPNHARKRAAMVAFEKARLVYREVQSSTRTASTEEREGLQGITTRLLREFGVDPTQPSN